MEKNPVMRNRDVVVVFTKAPQICRVKTRLWPALTHRQCLYLHKQATRNIIEKLSGQNNYQLLVYTTNKHPAFLVPEHVKINLQSGFNLGQRMHHAIAEQLKVFNRVVVVGSDCLELTTDYINDAFCKLNSPRDIVLGPATDGGYVLIGMSRPHSILFHNIAWGSSKVLDQTLDNAKTSNITAHLLSPLIDIDCVQDLQTLQKAKRLPTWASSLLPTH